MIHAHIDEAKTVPLWAALGAPLLGVPLMVAALALIAPGESAPPDGATLGSVHEVEVQGAVGNATELDAGCPELPQQS